jgi:hypothetical protein
MRSRTGQITDSAFCASDIKASPANNNANLPDGWVTERSFGGAFGDLTGARYVISTESEVQYGST